MSCSICVVFKQGPEKRLLEKILKIDPQNQGKTTLSAQTYLVTQFSFWEESLNGVTVTWTNSHKSHKSLGQQVVVFVSIVNIHFTYVQRHNTDTFT